MIIAELIIIGIGISLFLKAISKNIKCKDTSINTTIPSAIVNTSTIPSSTSIERIEPLSLTDISLFIVLENSGDNLNVDENEECALCLETYIKDQIVRKLKCNHIYHRDCIDQWLNEKETCPLCRFEIG